MKGSEICYDKNKCTGCSLCVNICPHTAIKMKADRFGFIYPNIDSKKCIDCKLCQRRCPMNMPPLEKFSVSKAAIFIENNKEYLMAASSGGAFGVLARYILQQKGTVYGCYMSPKYEVKHIGIKSLDDLKLLHGSKYVQSNINYSYRECKKDLENGNFVLFTGCPCQIAGLKNYLGKDYDKLLTIDLICHGVPNQKIFKSYINDLNHNNKKESKTFRFRYKGTSSSIYEGYHSKDYFMSYFLWGKINRPSCYKCRFAGGKRQGDFTIGDFWDNDILKFNINTKDGASLIIFNSSKSLDYIPLYKENGLFNFISEEQIMCRGGGQLQHPTQKDIRTSIIYWLYRLFGIQAVKLLFYINQKISYKN